MEINLKNSITMYAARNCKDQSVSNAICITSENPLCKPRRKACVNCRASSLLTEKVSPVIVGPLVDALNRQQPLLQRTSMLPQSLAGRWFENGDPVGQRRPMNPVALAAAGKTDLAFPLAADLVAEERTRL